MLVLVDDETDNSEPQDEIDELEDAFSKASPGALVKARIVFDPDGEPATLDDLKLRRDDEVYPQVVRHVRTQAGARPGVYRLQLKQGRATLANVRLNLLFASTTEVVVPTPAAMPAARGENPDFLHEINAAVMEQVKARVLASFATPAPAPAAEDEEEDEDDDEEEDVPGVVERLVDRVLENESMQALVGDQFDAWGAERRARAKKIDAEAELLKLEVERRRRELPPTISGLGAEMRKTATGEVVKLRLAGGGEK